jgi:hypothetical protein
VGVYDLVKANDVGMLQLFHCLDLSFDFLLHTELTNLVFVQDFESHRLVNSLVDSHYERQTGSEVNS